jgi:uncharacterized membrane protein
MPASSETPRTVIFRARLTPHRSLSRRAFRRVMAATALFSLSIALGAWFAGAWPVFGFMGLDVLVVYLALRASYRRGRVSELLELDEHALTVERMGLRGDLMRWSLQPTWLKVELSEPILPQTPVLLRTHGQALPVGVFLHPEQRREVADDLRRALEIWRRPGPLSV